MENKRRAPQQQPINSHLKSLASYLMLRPKNVDFKLYDWLRTRDLNDLVRMHKDANSIFESFVTQSPPTKQARDLAKAACLAYGAEAPSVEPEFVTEHLDALLRGMDDAVYIEILARRGWVIVTDRMSIWPRTQKPIRYRSVAGSRASVRTTLVHARYWA